MLLLLLVVAAHVGRGCRGAVAKEQRSRNPHLIFYAAPIDFGGGQDVRRRVQQGGGGGLQAARESELCPVTARAQDRGGRRIKCGGGGAVSKGLELWIGGEGLDIFSGCVRGRWVYFWSDCLRRARGGDADDSRRTDQRKFSEVAQLVDCTCLDIYAHLPASMLTPATAYVAYLVFATVDGHRGLSFPDQETTVSVGDHITSRHTVCLRPDIVETHRFIGLEGCGSDDVRVPALRTDGWWEMEMGRLRTGGDHAMAREEEEVVASFEVLGWYPKCGLVVEGVEFRPLCL